MTAERVRDGRVQDTPDSAGDCLCVTVRLEMSKRNVSQDQASTRRGKLYLTWIVLFSKVAIWMTCDITKKHTIRAMQLGECSASGTISVSSTSIPCHSSGKSVRKLYVGRTRTVHSPFWQVYLTCRGYAWNKSRLKHC